MAPLVLLRSPVASRRKTCFSQENSKTPRTGKKFGEVAGETAAECAAVCCCCPCTVMELVIMGLYTVPSGLCKKAWRKRKLRAAARRRKSLLGQVNSDQVSELDLVVGTIGRDLDDQDSGTARAFDMDKEMWDQFYGTGFWRSSSQKDM